MVHMQRNFKNRIITIVAILFFLLHFTWNFFYTTTCILVIYLQRAFHACHVNFNGMSDIYLSVLKIVRLFMFKLTGSFRFGRTTSRIAFNMPSICWWHPSAQADIAIKAACLYLQSAKIIKMFIQYSTGNYRNVADISKWQANTTIVMAERFLCLNR